MKIVLDLDNSINNYNWENVEELEKYIKKDMLVALWELYNKLLQDNANILDGDLNRLYDILDMFTTFEIKKENWRVYHRQEVE